MGNGCGVELMKKSVITNEYVGQKTFTNTRITQNNKTVLTTTGHGDMIFTVENFSVY
jgi:hypothetical protein